MKPEETQEGFSRPGSGFFERQFASVMARTVDLENWELPGTRNVEIAFPVPEGWWPAMEDGIRARVARPESSVRARLLPARTFLVPAALVVVLAFGYWFLATRNDAPPQPVTICHLTPDEMLAFVAESDPDLVQAESGKWMTADEISLLTRLEGLPEGESKPARDFVEESLPYPELEQTLPDEL